ncbi:MAG: hypothetical protein A3F67_10180 [Verrucomicrobia bacterium RIFCSPHIGHO2_12_FULL_41_10]|nr:MAG: hypothetical protein A3F67_10180 [Verrucomicrobia bacterium RIFCSPHIGHO2_12_FULL_41_10]
MLFEWPLKTSPRLALPLFLLLAVILHVSTIFLFNIVYDPPQVTKPVSAQILFLLPGSPASEKLSSWLQANDPAIFSPLKTAAAVRPKITPYIYQSHYILPLPLRPLPSQEEKSIEPLLPSNSEITVPPTLDPALFFPTNTFYADTNLNSTKQQWNLSNPQEILSIPTKKTSVRFFDNLTQRLPLVPLEAPVYPDSITTPLRPTELTINIDAEGIPRHAIIRQSSENPLADETATHWVMAQHFTPSSHENWGHILVLWGTN